MVAPVAPPAAAGAAKTMFGYAAPIVKPGQVPGVPQAPAPMAAPQVPAPMAPAPMAAPPQYQQPPAPQYQQPPAPQYQQPPAPQGYPQQPPAPQYQQPPAPQGYPQPQQPPQGYPPPQAQQAYPPPQDPAAAYPQNLPGPLDDIARAMPTSKPGTIFGFPVSRLSDPGFQRLILLIAGSLLLLSMFIPVFSFPTGRDSSKLMFSWSSIEMGPFSIGPGMGRYLIWPLLAGVAYLLVAAAPAHIRAKVPPVVLQWLPFTVAYIGVFISNMGLSVGNSMAGFMALGGRSISGKYEAFVMVSSASYTMATLAFPLLVFGLLARIARPTDMIARYIIAGGAALMLFPALATFGWLGVGGLMTLVVILTLLMNLLAVFCGLFVVPPAKLPPALRALDSLAPLFCAIMVAWLPLRVILVAVALPGDDMGSTRLWMILHGLIPVVAYFFVLMMTAPAAYEAAMGMFKKGPGAPPAAPPTQAPPGYPQGGGYPPPAAGYPPAQGGFPPPQGGGYPPPQ